MLFWRTRAEAAEAVAAQWRTIQNRTLWKLFSALDQLRARVAPLHTRRARLVLGTAHAAARVLAATGRARGVAADQLKPRGHKDVLFVYDEPGAWTIYRCDHHAEQLKCLGMSSDVVRSDGIDLVAALDQYETFILNRVEWSERIAAFVDGAHSAEKSVIFGTDDLIFEPDLYRQFAFLDEAAESDREAWRERLDGFRRTMAACDGAIVSTEPLARYARRLISRVHVVSNAVSSDMVRHADEALESRSFAEKVASGRDVTIAYLSGTPSHNRDFSEAADAVVWALETYPHAWFLVVGRLDLDPRFEAFGSRVTRIPKQRFDALPTLIARIDINLAPLEPGNPFTECKSCVKYLEAALLAVPTIASPRPDLARVIDAGRNGLLADNPDEWREALGRLIESEEVRRQIGAEAHEDVRRNHTTEVCAPMLEQALADLGSGLLAPREAG